DANAKACFGFTAPARVDLRDRARQQQVLTNTYAGIGWEVPRLLELMPGAPDFPATSRRASRVRSVSIQPGSTALTWMFSFAHAVTQARVNCTMPPLLAA